ARIQWLFSPQVRRVVQRQGDGVTRPGADAKHPPLSKLAQARISRCRSKPWLATRSMPEPKDLHGLFGLVQTVNDKVITVNNPADPAVPPEQPTATRQLGKCQGRVQQLQPKSFPGSSVIACDIGQDPVEIIFSRRR